MACFGQINKEIIREYFPSNRNRLPESEESSQESNRSLEDLTEDSEVPILNPTSGFFPIYVFKKIASGITFPVRWAGRRLVDNYVNWLTDDEEDEENISPPENGRLKKTTRCKQLYQEIVSKLRRLDNWGNDYK